MNDLELTKLCAEAMGEEIHRVDDEGLLWTRDDPRIAWYVYRPLHDDTQAMALVKKFGLYIWGKRRDIWGVTDNDPGTCSAANTNLNYAICECVAKMKIAS